VAGLATSFGAGAASNSFNQIGDADTLFIIGSNTTEGHPVVSLHVKKALRRGARLIVADPRKIELARRSHLWLDQKPGTNIALLNGLAHIILNEGWENRKFIKKRAEGFEAFREKVQEYDPDRVEQITGVAKDKLHAAAKMYAQTQQALLP
jgi:predicted molibdopterin-dependent oxidoreductase YjgC